MANSAFRYSHLIGTLQTMKDNLLTAEIGVNIKEGGEAIYLKNDQDEVIEFSPTKDLDDKIEGLKKELKGEHNSDISDLSDKIAAISELLGVEGKDGSNYDDSGDGILDKMHRNLKDVNDKLGKINEKRIVYWSEDEGNGRRHIVLPNHDSIVGTMPDGDNANLMMLSKWGIADFGSSKAHINLNGNSERPTYNDSQDIALTKDIPTVEVDEQTVIINTFLNKD